MMTSSSSQTHSLHRQTPPPMKLLQAISSPAKFRPAQGPSDAADSHPAPARAQRSVRLHEFRVPGGRRAQEGTHAAGAVMPAATAARDPRAAPAKLPAVGPGSGQAPCAPAPGPGPHPGRSRSAAAAGRAGGQTDVSAMQPNWGWGHRWGPPRPRGRNPQHAHAPFPPARAQASQPATNRLAGGPVAGPPARLGRLAADSLAWLPSSGRGGARGWVRFGSAGLFTCLAGRVRGGRQRQAGVPPRRPYGAATRASRGPRPRGPTRPGRRGSDRGYVPYSKQPREPTGVVRPGRQSRWLLCSKWSFIA
ncbi:hypothetical protein GQ55_2G060300 [Panicum hallii var. hallii]|uniref:Uncharacterized protein n=1 Tax=Panicum hallii var. hallii TaxID=1504633 RepID=A0A2T7ELX1_9POAL|nr:hypothetical protein GQ55_2G060300 [Panicum hallii var. hallii]